MRARAPRPVRVWLWVVFASILVMTLIGGTTRLTGSGLSMVVWHPLMGAIPPLNEADWHRVFDLYKATPQYLHVNDWMALADFKRIFFWEYLHRLFGRMIGLVVLVPWVWFVARRQLSGAVALRTLALIGLGGAQGLLGWYMVQSGLVDVPRVSHFRLAAHLSLAFVCAQYAAWLAFDLAPAPQGRPPRWIGHGALALLAGLSLQIVYGAFTAGLRAGHYAATFPDINGHWLPGALLAGQGWAEALLHGVGIIHYTHRALGLVVLLGALGLGGAALRSGSEGLRAPAVLLMALVATQFTLGAATVMLHVPTSLAVAHQGVALLLLTALTWLLHRCFRSAPSDGGAQPT